MRATYSNPTPPASDHAGELKAEQREFWRLILGVAALLLALVFVLDRAALWLAPRLPFQWERQLAASLHMDRMGQALSASSRPTDAARQRRLEADLQARTDRIARALALPPEMVLTAHYVDSPTVNAFATLGGHITVFQGLLDKMEYSEELDAVLAHEIGHVQHRHLVRQLSRGLSVAAALGLVGIRSATLNRWLIGDAQQLQQLAYSRQAEREADATAQAATRALHGHTQGLVRLFQRFDAMRQQGHASPDWLAFTQSHPLPAERLAQAQAAGPGVALSPLPGMYRRP